MLKKIWGMKLARFLTVGIFNTLFDITMLNSLVFLGHIPYVAANLISASISMTVSYFLNHRIVFKHQERQSLVQYLHFFAVTGIGILGIQSLVIYAMTHFLGHHRALVTSLIHSLHVATLTPAAFDLNVGKVAAVLIAMAWNFTVYHFVIFKKPSDGLDDELLA
jgi:putative flippase GtrA